MVDFGAQYAQLIARRVREARVFSEVIPHTASVEEIKARQPLALVLSGGPASVYAEGAPQLDPALFDLGVPVFGICYGFQAMAQALGGTVARTGTSEYGRTELKVVGGELHSGLPSVQPVWMSHGDAVTAAPDGFDVVASSAGAAVAAFENRERRLAGVQYHPEVMHTPHGQQVLSRFLHDFAGLGAEWTPANIAGALIEQVRAQIGGGHAICGLSGGVDSAVAAALVQRAIGEKLTCVFVDHGLLRAGERAQVQRDFVAATGANLVDRRRGGDFPAGAVGCDQSRRQTQNHWPAVHPGIRGCGAGCAGRRGIHWKRSRVSGPGHAVSGRGGVRWGQRHREHQEPPQRRRPARRPEVQTRRAAAAAVQRRGARGRAGIQACRRKSLPGNPFRVPVWASGSSARSPHSGWTRCGAPTRSRARS